MPKIIEFNVETGERTEREAAEGELVFSPPAPVVYSCSPWQIRKALNQLGLRASVEAAVAASSQEVKDGWEFATEFRSDNELIAQLCTALGKTEAERMEIFQMAATL